MRLQLCQILLASIIFALLKPKKMYKTGHAFFIYYLKKVLLMT